MKRIALAASLMAAFGFHVIDATAQTLAGHRGQEGTESPDTLELNSSTVSAWRSEVSVTPAQTLDGEALHRLSGMSVSDAIRYFSGMQVKDYGGIGGLKTINVRSLGSQHVGVFYDGVQIGNAQNGTVDLGRFSLENMEAISLYNGQKTTFLQSATDYASANTVYLVSRVPRFESGRRHNLKATLSTGSFKTVNPSLLWEFRLTPKISASLDASWLYTSGEYRFTYAKKDGYDTTAIRHNGDVKALRTEIGIFGNMAGGSWKVKAYLYDSERGYPGAFVRETPGFFRNEDRQWDRNIFVQGSVDRRWGIYRLAAKARYADDFLRYVSDPRKDVSTMYVDNRYHQKETYLSLANGFSIFPWWNANIAVDWKFNDLDSDLQGFSFPQRSSLLSAVASTWNWKFLKAQASLLHTWINDRTTDGDVSNRSRFSPAASISARPIKGEDFLIRAFYKRSFRMPTLNDLYYVQVGNRDLDPETTDQYDLGVTWQKRWSQGFWRSIEANAETYFNQVWNKIVAVPARNQFQWTMMNLGYVEILGSELSATAEAAIGSIRKDELTADVRLAYTYQRARDLTDPGSEWYGGQIAYIPRHSMSAVAGLSWGGYSLNYSFLYTGERYESSANIPENHQQPWYTSDISLSGSWPVKGHELMARLELNNIFNQQYEIVNCYPMPGTNFRIVLSFAL